MGFIDPQPCDSPTTSPTPLSCETDSITVCQGTIPWEVTGEFTSTVEIVFPFSYPGDSPSNLGDEGALVLAVRNDTHSVLTSVDGNYSPISVDSDGAVQISDGGNSITVDAVALDIRTLDASTDSVEISDGGNSITVDAVSLDIRNLDSSTDSVEISDGGNSITVDAVDFDIRNLDSATDSVEIITNVPLPVVEQTGLVPVIYDYIQLAYTGDDITTVVYKQGGAGGSTIATLSLVYSSPGVLSTVTRT